MNMNLILAINLASEALAKNHNGKAMVLVVDDDIRILNFIRLRLRLAGYNVITATDGEEALKLIDSKKPSIMLLDVVMAPMDGFEVLRRLRMVSELPVIAMSAHSSTAAEAISLGASDFMSKPFQPDELVKRIKVLLNTR